MAIKKYLNGNEKYLKPCDPNLKGKFISSFFFDKRTEVINPFLMPLLASLQCLIERHNGRMQVAKGKMTST